jgi:hypothetical protein
VAAEYLRLQKGISGCSGGWQPPPKDRNNEARNQETYCDADFYPVPDRRCISMSNPLRPAYEQPGDKIRTEQQPVNKIRAEVRDFSLDKAIPQFVDANEAQIDCDDTSEDFIKQKLHSNIRSSSYSFGWDVGRVRFGVTNDRAQGG